MSFLTDKYFWINTAERVVKTFAQSLGLVFLGDEAYNIINVNWTESLALAGTGALLALLTSVASAGVGTRNSPSLVSNKVEEQVVEKIEAGEPVGDPPKVIEPAVHPEEPVVAKPAKAARKPRKKSV